MEAGKLGAYSRDYSSETILRPICYPELFKVQSISDLQKFLDFLIVGKRSISVRRA